MTTTMGQQERPRAEGERPLAWAFCVERMTGIEPAYSAWEADVLPLNYIREAASRPPWASLAALLHEVGPRCHCEACTARPGR